MHSTDTPDQVAGAEAFAQAPAMPPLQWAIVELMGHAKIAGAVSQDVACGLPLIRVDVPQITHTEQVWRNGAYVPERRVIPAHSRSLGAAAIYSINWCDEASARIAAFSIQHTPLRAFSLKAVLEGMPESEQQQLLALTAGSALASAMHSGEDDEPF